MIVIIDNHDSFTYNLVHYFEQLDDSLAVFQNGCITAEEISELSPDLIVLSPGPGRPAKAGASHEVLELLSCKVPILGVCLGHQAIIEHFGGKIIKGAEPVHGKVSLMTHDTRGLFRNIPSPTPVTRYHSLVGDGSSMPGCLEVTAQSEDGAIMGVRHQVLPVTGIQFHPESILTAEGFGMLQNCYEQAKAWRKQREGAGTDGKPIPAL